MQCPQCHAPLEDNAVFCGTCGKQLAPLNAQGATIVSPDMEGTQISNINRLAPPYNTPPYNTLPAPQQSLHAERFVAPSTLSTPNTHTPSHGNDLTTGGQPTRRNNHFTFLALIIGLVIIVVIASVIFVVHPFSPNPPLPPKRTVVASAATASGQVTFTDSQSGQPGHTNSLTMQVTGLKTPPSGSQYQSWLINDQTEQVLPLGTLTATGAAFAVKFDANATQSTPTNNFLANNLLGEGNRLEVTLEQGTASLPSGSPVLLGIFPPRAFVHVRHLLYSFPTTPQKIGLLVGTREQIEELNGQAQILQNVLAAHNWAAVACTTQSMLDVIEGTNGAHYQPLAANCAALNIAISGDGFGLLGNNNYISLGEQHAALAANQSDSTDTIRTGAQKVETTLKAITGWLTTIDNDLVALHANPHNATSESEILQLCDQALHGDSTATAPGAIGAYQQGQQMATLTLNIAS